MIGVFMNKGLTMSAGQTPVQRYTRPLLEKIEKGEIDPAFVITYRLELADTPVSGFYLLLPWFSSDGQP